MPLVFVFVILVWILAVALHEFAHAWVAYKGGDESVKYKGYLTLNPLKYTEPMVSIILPLVIIAIGGIGLPGGAVYINFRQITNRWMQSAVSLAGPVMTLAVAVVLAIPFMLGMMPAQNYSALWPALAFAVQLQLFAFLFNLLPLPPLDGYGVMRPWLPYETQRTLNSVGNFGILLLFVLFLAVPGFSRTLFAITWSMMDVLGIPPDLAYEGYRMFRFWEQP